MFKIVTRNPLVADKLQANGYSVTQILNIVDTSSGQIGALKNNKEWVLVGEKDVADLVKSPVTRDAGLKLTEDDISQITKADERKIEKIVKERLEAKKERDAKAKKHRR